MSTEGLPDDQRHKQGGAVLEFHDGRVSSIVAWFFGVLGIAFVSLVGLTAKNLYDLNVTVARSIDADLARDIRLNDHEERLRQVERNMSTIEGRVMRGIEEMTKEEPRRGK